MARGVKGWAGVGNGETAAGARWVQPPIQAGAGGDVARSFAEVYATLREPVYWYCYARLGDRERAEDATSLTFTKALAAFGNHQPDRVRGWVFSLARNVVIDQFRESRSVAPIEAAHAITARGPSPEEIVVLQEGHDRVRALLRRLSDAQRQIVELRLAGLTGAEIARVMGRSHVWVRVNQMRAYWKLRVILEAESEDDAI